MRRMVYLLTAIAVGLLAAWAGSANVASLSQSAGYRYGAYLLLAIGLYGATYGIDLAQAKKDKTIIVSAVTIGVIVKALIIGSVLALAWRNPLFLILGVAVAQIDPLSVAALMGDKRMSVRARNVLAAWSSFDDPFTVVLAIYAAAVAVNSFGLGNHPPSGTDPLLLYGIDLAWNLGIAAAAWLTWKYLPNKVWLRYSFLLLCFAVAVIWGWMLSIALIGLFARPAKLEKIVGRVTQVALYTAAVGLGFLLIDGIKIAEGISLGIAAYLAQMAVAYVLTRGMPSMDRWHLATAQQNGITAIILALTLQIQFDNVVAIVAPAIITVNLIHAAVNSYLDKHVAAMPNLPAPRAENQDEGLAGLHGPTSADPDPSGGFAGNDANIGDQKP